MFEDPREMTPREEAQQLGSHLTTLSCVPTGEPRLPSGKLQLTAPGTPVVLERHDVPTRPKGTRRDSVR